MASTTTSLINYNFGGIRRKDAVFMADKITCSDCQNVELFFTKLNSGVGIRTANGNVAITTCIPSGEEVIGMFESIQDGDSVIFVYTEETAIDGNGKLYILNMLADSLTLVDETLSKTGNACGCDFSQGWLDTFIFSNGTDVLYVYTDTSQSGSTPTLAPYKVTNATLYTISGSTVTQVLTGVNGSYGRLDVTISSQDKTLYRDKSLDQKILDTDYYGWTDGTNAYYTTQNVDILLYDTEGNKVSGLGLCVFDSRLWMFDGTTVWYSQQGECRVFNYQDPSSVTSAGYITFVKPITAIYPYLGTLAVFHKDSSALIQVNATTGFSVGDESPGGCAGYDSLVFHGTDLYFYDDTKKGVFSFQQIVNGDKTLGNNIAYDIQDELLEISDKKLNKIRTLSVVTSDRNEVWFLVPIEATYTVGESPNEVTKDASIVLIFDYIRGEWIKRKCQNINTIQILDSGLYSAGEQVYGEYVGNSFNGDFIKSEYVCTILNLGEDNTLKITKFPPRLAVDSSYANNFWVKYVKNYDVLKEPKEKEIKGKSTKNTLIFNSGAKWNDGSKYKVKGVNIVVKIPSATFKALEITFYTKNSGQDFCIKNIEFSKIKVKQV